MAITGGNAGAEGSAASGGITLGAPASPQNGDIWIAVVHSSDQVAHTLTDWTQIVQANGGGTTSRLSVWWFRYAGSTPNLVVGHTAGQSPIGGIKAFHGCKASGSPIGQAGTILGGTDASIESNAIVPNIQGSCLLVCNGSADDNNRTALGGDYAVAFEDTGASTQNCFVTTAGTPDGSVCLFYDLSVPDSSINPTVTQAAADPWASVLVELLAEPVNNTITGVVSISEAIAAALAYNIHPQIAGAVTVGETIASGMTYTLAGAVYSIDGAVSIGVTVASGMSEGRVLAGAVTISIAISSQILEGRVLEGAVAVGFSVSSGMIEGRVLAGAVAVGVSIASGMVEGRVSAGSVPVGIAVSSGMVYAAGGAEAYEIAGAVALFVAISSQLTHTRYVPPEPARPITYLGPVSVGKYGLGEIQFGKFRPEVVQPFTPYPRP